MEKARLGVTQLTAINAGKLVTSQLVPSAVHKLCRTFPAVIQVLFKQIMVKHEIVLGYREKLTADARNTVSTVPSHAIAVNSW